LRCERSSLKTKARIGVVFAGRQGGEWRIKEQIVILRCGVAQYWDWGGADARDPRTVLISVILIVWGEKPANHFKINFDLPRLTIIDSFSNTIPKQKNNWTKTVHNITNTITHTKQQQQKWKSSKISLEKLIWKFSVKLLTLNVNTTRSQSPSEQDSLQRSSMKTNPSRKLLKNSTSTTPLLRQSLPCTERNSELLGHLLIYSPSLKKHKINPSLLRIKLNSPSCLLLVIYLKWRIPRNHPKRITMKSYTSYHRSLRSARMLYLSNPQDKITLFNSNNKKSLNNNKFQLFLLLWWLKSNSRCKLNSNNNNNNNYKIHFSSWFSYRMQY